jgi:spermidine synthase
MNILKKVISYFMPLAIKRESSDYSGVLELNLYRNQLLLDTANTNYSYGSLQKILRKGLKYIGFEKVKKFKTVLVLGLGGGSVVKTLREEIDFKGKIVGIDIDQKVIDLALKVFEMNKIENLVIFIYDAFDYILQTKSSYDLIIVDIFLDSAMPNFLFENHFVDELTIKLNKNGFVLFNTMILSDYHEQRNQKYIAYAEKIGLSVRRYPRVEQHNELIILKKTF